MEIEWCISYLGLWQPSNKNTWFKTTEMYPFTVLEATRSNQVVHLVGSCVLWGKVCHVVCSWIPTFLGLHLSLFDLCLYLCLSPFPFSVVGIKACPNSLSPPPPHQASTPQLSHHVTFYSVCTSSVPMNTHVIILTTHANPSWFHLNLNLNYVWKDSICK